VFPSEKLTTPLSRDNVWRRHIQPKLEPVGLGWANFLVFRRTFATLSCEEGADAKLIADQMGHTVDVYQNVHTKSHHNQRKDLADRLAGKVGLKVIIEGRNAA
jgi:integrase